MVDFAARAAGSVLSGDRIKVALDDVGPAFIVGVRDQRLDVLLIVQPILLIYVLINQLV